MNRACGVEAADEVGLAFLLRWHFSFALALFICVGVSLAQTAALLEVGWGLRARHHDAVYVDTR